ncbi:cathelicidin-3-like [Rhineura floridana]|uniref:cathelicidin-3-like n=1 Tax=Rhineura floridana TaxID=261503 RepID=UPI002AC81807|nr:cathelicidin-3-like [Rhineura floridana]
MKSCWGVLLLASLVTAAPLSPPRTFQEALSQAVDIYNQGPKIQNAFRLLEAAPQPGLNSSSGYLQQLNFTIQETVCPTSEKVNAEQCDFKPNGLVRDCSGYFSVQQANSVIVITCDAAVREPVRVTRFRGLGILLRGIGKGLGRLWGSNNQ